MLVDIDYDEHLYMTFTFQTNLLDILAECDRHYGRIQNVDNPLTVPLRRHGCLICHRVYYKCTKNVDQVSEKQYRPFMPGQADTAQADDCTT